MNQATNLKIVQQDETTARNTVATVATSLHKSEEISQNDTILAWNINVLDPEYVKPGEILLKESCDFENKIVKDYSPVQNSILRAVSSNNEIILNPETLLHLENAFLGAANNTTKGCAITT